MSKEKRINVIKVIAYKASDGKIFECIGDAIKHDKETWVKRKRSETLNEKSDWIAQYILDKFDDDDFRRGKPELSDVGYAATGEWGWDCDSKENPIDKCIYSHQLYWGDDCCIFCGEPEERK